MKIFELMSLIYYIFFIKVAKENNKFDTFEQIIPKNVPLMLRFKNKGHHDKRLFLIK